MHGVQRLRFLDGVPFAQQPNGSNMPLEPSTTEFLSAFRAYAHDAIPPEFLDERQDIWRILGAPDIKGPDEHPNPPGDWWTMRPSWNLVEYRSLLQTDFRCDNDSCEFFVRLMRIRTPQAYIEGLRIIYHLIKDKDTATSPQDPAWSLQEHNSHWLKTACIEALEALEFPEVWNHGPQQNAKGASKGKWRDPFANDGPSWRKGGGKGDAWRKGGGKGTSSSSHDGTYSRQGYRG